MSKTFRIKPARPLFFLLILDLILAQPGRAGDADSIHRDDPAIYAWAQSCEIVRGPGIITFPDSVEVLRGEGREACGKADGLVVSLGDGGMATLEFAETLSDRPGPDLAVFENSFDGRFLELAFVEVSSDRERYVRFPARSATPTDTQVGSFGTLDHRQLENLAGKYPAEWGTAFDLVDLKDSSGIDLDMIRSVRIIDVVGILDSSKGSFDAYGNLINDPFPTAFESGGFDLDALALINDSPTGPGPEKKENCRLYPNPCHKEIYLESPVRSDWEILDPGGVQVLAGKAGAGINRIDLNGLGTGMYFLRLYTGGRACSMKFIKTLAF